MTYIHKMWSTDTKICIKYSKVVCFLPVTLSLPCVVSRYLAQPLCCCATHLSQTLPTDPQHSFVAHPRATSVGHGVFLDPKKQKLSHIHCQLAILVAITSFTYAAMDVIKLLDLYLRGEVIVLQL